MTRPPAGKCDSVGMTFTLSTGPDNDFLPVVGVQLVTARLQGNTRGQTFVKEKNL